MTDEEKRDLLKQAKENIGYGDSRSDSLHSIEDYLCSIANSLYILASETGATI